MKNSVIVLLTWWSFACLADDGYVSSKGGNVFPDFGSPKSIKMLRESVHIDLLRDSCNAYCKFWFLRYKAVNNRPEQYITVGFPNYVESPSEMPPPLRNFKCKVNGKEAEVSVARQVTRWKDLKTGKDEDVEHVRSWFVWGVDLAPFDTVVIENWYTGEWGGSFATKDFQYILGTGATWDGPILDGRIVFDYSGLASDLFVVRKKEPDISTDSHELQPKCYEDSLVYTFTNLRPSEDQSVYISVVSFWDDPYKNIEKTTTFSSVYVDTVYGLFSTLRKQTMEPSKYRTMRNEIFARHGYVFSDRQLADYFAAKSWYRPNRSFSQSQLNKYELKSVEVLLQLEKQHSSHFPK
jgi:hypothetical protein